MRNYRFKRTGKHWRVQKRKLIFFWEDFKVRELLIEVSDIEQAYPTLESILNIQIEGIVYSINKTTADIIYKDKN